MAPTQKSRYVPLILTLFIILSDQLSKAWIVKNVAENTIGWRFLGDFLAISPSAWVIACRCW